MSGTVPPELAVVVAAAVVVTTAVVVEGSRAVVLVVSSELVNGVRYVLFEQAGISKELITASNTTNHRCTGTSLWDIVHDGSGKSAQFPD
jgi:hypothetical protein